MTTNTPQTYRFEPRHPTDPFSELGVSTSPARSGAEGLTFNPERYAALRSYVQTLGWNTLLKGRVFRAGESILDLGFGDGGNAAALAQQLQPLQCTVFGVEKSPQMVAHARASYAQSEHPNLHLLCGPAESAGEVLAHYAAEAGLELSKVSLVVSNYTLHWLRDPSNPRRFLHEEMFRSLNSVQEVGGEQLHFCAHADAFKELFEAGYNVMRESSSWRDLLIPREGEHSDSGEWRHPPLITQEGIEAALTGGGYEATVELLIEERAFPNWDILKEWVGAMIRPFMERIPDTARKNFVDAWVGRYQADNQDMLHAFDSPVLLDRNLLIRARKNGPALDA
jgi:SAM-dependent methyltransferase